jgi:hypothetical protein
MMKKLLMAAAAVSCMVSSAQAASIDWVTWLGASPTTAIGAIKLGDGSVVPGDGSVVPGDGSVKFGDGSVIPGDGSVTPGDGSVIPGDGSVRPGDGSVMPGDGSVVPGPNTMVVTALAGDGSVRTLTAGGPLASFLPREGGPAFALSLSLGLPATDAFFFLDLPGLSDAQFGDGSVKVLDSAFGFDLGGAVIPGSLMQFSGKAQTLALLLQGDGPAGEVRFALGFAPGAIDLPQPIPLPAAGFLLVGGLAGLGLMRRRAA